MKLRAEDLVWDEKKSPFIGEPSFSRLMHLPTGVYIGGPSMEKEKMLIALEFYLELSQLLEEDGSTAIGD